MKITNNKKQEIDWDKQQLLITETGKTILLTDGKHKGNYFSGLCLTFGAYIDNPHYSEEWVKSNFEVYNGTISND